LKGAGSLVMESAEIAHAKFLLQAS
jgi:hypothetical protein